MENKKRFPFIDFIRGFAVILMVYFHLAYDLTMFHYTDIDFLKDPFWFWLPRFIVFLFLLSVGVSIGLAHKNKLHVRAYLLRLAKIGTGAILISIGSYYAFPKNWIYFGTLHCIFFVTILVTPLRKHPVISLILAITILGLDLTLYAIPFWEMRHPSLDYIPLFPWISVSLLGIFAYKIGIHKINLPCNVFVNFVNKLGRHAFKIYILHQPILYGLVYAARKLWPKQ
jgi:uncharacterized membrane protein